MRIRHLHYIKLEIVRLSLVLLGITLIGFAHDLGRKLRKVAKYLGTCGWRERLSDSEAGDTNATHANIFVRCWAPANSCLGGRVGVFEPYGGHAARVMFSTLCVSTQHSDLAPKQCDLECGDGICITSHEKYWLLAAVE